MLSHFSRVQLFAAPWTVAHQAPLSMGFHRQEYWSGLPCPPPGNLPDPGGRTHVSYISCIGRQILHHLATWEASLIYLRSSCKSSSCCPFHILFALVGLSLHQSLYFLTRAKRNSGNTHEKLVGVLPCEGGRTQSNGRYG